MSKHRSVEAEKLTGLVISLPIPDVCADNNEIVRLASLTRKAKFTDQDQAELDRASYFDRVFIVMASNLLDDKRFQVCSDNPKTLDRARSLAQHLGAFVVAEFNDRSAGKPAILFDPAPRK
jgi:hypothetical protein